MASEPTSNPNLANIVFAEYAGTLDMVESSNPTSGSPETCAVGDKIAPEMIAANPDLALGAVAPSEWRCDTCNISFPK
jgi:hypothetical protein